jgi:hypothetical protein
MVDGIPISATPFDEPARVDREEDGLWKALQQLREEEHESRQALTSAMDAHEKLMVRRFKAEVAYVLAVAGVRAGEKRA